MSMFRRQSWIIVAVVVLAAIAGAWFLQPISKLDAVVELKSGQRYPEPKALAGFKLVDQHGKPFTLEQLQGKWSFVFFGYTTCPDICPMTLSEMARLQSMLPDALKNDTRFVFISVDPERDTVEQLAQYLPFFNADIIGVTGDLDATTAFARQLGVAAVKVPQEGGSYLVDHSVRVFLLNPKGERYALFSPTVGASFRADELLADYLMVRRQN